MKNIKNIKKGILKLVPKVILSSMVLMLTSCDFSYELAEANSKEDTKAPTAFFGSVNGEDDEWNKVDFANESISASNYVWDFGDGTATSTEFEPTGHSYPPTSGSYEVVLNVSDNNSLTDTYTKTVTVIDNGVVLGDLKQFYDIINTGEEGDPVTVDSYSSYQISKDAFAENTLDGDIGTIWTAEAGAILVDDFKSEGEYIIYDLGSILDVRVLQFATNIKSDPYGYQFWVSNTDTDAASFTKIIPETGEIALSQAGSAEFQTTIFTVPVNARYVKLVGFGRFNAEGDTRKSAWMSFSEIEFYKDKQ